MEILTIIAIVFGAIIHIPKIKDVFEYAGKGLRFKEGQMLLSDIQEVQEETVRGIEDVIESGTRLIPQQLQVLAGDLIRIFEGFAGRYGEFYREVEKNLARRIMAFTVRGRNKLMSDFRLEFELQRDMLSLAWHTMILLVAREPRIGSTASLQYNFEDVGIIKQWVRVDLSQIWRYLNGGLRTRHVVLDHRARLIDYAEEALRGSPPNRGGRDQSLPNNHSRLNRPHSRHDKGYYVSSSNGPILPRRPPPLRAEPSCPTQMHNRSHSRDDKGYYVSSSKGPILPSRPRDPPPLQTNTSYPTNMHGEPFRVVESHSVRNQSPHNNHSRRRTNPGPNRSHSCDDKGYYVSSSKDIIPPSRLGDPPSRRTDPSYPTRTHDEPLRVTEDPGSRGRSYHSHNNYKASQKLLFEDPADTCVRNGSEPHVQLQGVGSTAPPPFDRGRSSFMPPSVETPRSDRESDRDHSVLNPESRYGKQVSANSNPYRLHEARQNQIIADRNGTAPSSSFLSDTDTVEMCRRRVRRRDIIPNQGVESGNTPRSAVSRNRSVSENRQNSVNYGAERRLVPATTRLHEHPATPRDRSRSRAPPVPNPEIDAPRAPVGQPREQVTVAKPRPPRDGSVARSLDSGYDEPQPPHRTPNVTASRPPIAYYNVRGRKSSSRSRSRSRHEGYENSRASSESRDSGIGLDDGCSAQHAFPINSYMGEKHARVREERYDYVET